MKRCDGLVVVLRFRGGDGSTVKFGHFDNESSDLLVASLPSEGEEVWMKLASWTAVPCTIQLPS